MGDVSSRATVPRNRMGCNLPRRVQGAPPLCGCSSPRLGGVMDVSANPPTQAADRGVEFRPPGIRRSPRRRRPSGQPPPLPHHLQTTGVGWLTAAVVLVTLSLLVFADGLRGLAVEVTVVEDAVVEWLAGLEVPGLLPAMRGLAALGSWTAMNVLLWGLLLALLLRRRLRQLLVVLLAWILYSLVPEGRWRQSGKWVATALVALIALARMYLGVEAPTDILVGVTIGVAIALLAFRLLAPSQVFPISYRRGRTAHLDVGGARGQAIRRALHDQLGLVVEEVEPFGLAGSAGSTPLRITVAGDPPTILFGKLYARSHLRADRWYKLGRELLYGRLEDKKPFNTVRRLVQQEDYALQKLYLAGLPSPTPYGFVELTPEREYLLVTEFFDGAVELGEAPVDDRIMDDGLGIIRKLWDAGLAHRDIKPANLLVRDGRVLLIDVAFVEARPSPWRQAVDLANMMLCLALRSSPEQVYRRALQFFTVEEITEGFAAAHGLALPTQLRQLLRTQGRDLHGEFVRLLPTPPRPIRMQRWTARRVGLWAAILAFLLVLAALSPRYLFTNFEDAVETPLEINDVGCSDLEPLWLMAQSVPSAALVPCVQLLTVGWSVAEVAVNNGRSVITLHHDRAGKRAVVVRLTAACDLTGAAEVTSEQPGTRRYLRIDQNTAGFSATRAYVFPGGCITARISAPAGSGQQLTTETSSATGFTTRQELRQALTRRSDGRLQLDPQDAR